MPIFALLFAVLFALTACGGDSGNSSKPTEGEQELSSSDRATSSSSYKITSATNIIDDEAVDIKDDTPSQGSVVDYTTGKTYKTLTLGIYTWIDENIVDRDLSIKSTCYAYDDANCSEYGRLYMQKNASDMCPSSFKLPTVSDWEYRFERSADNPLTYGGVCYKRDTLECEGLKDSAMYLAYGDSAVLLTRSGKISGLRSTDNGFYSLRCVKYRSIVYKMYELPDCDEDRSYNYPSVYVVDKDSSYSCYRGKWTDASHYHNCKADEEGQKYLVNGMVYICKNGSWELTTIEDTDVRCTNKNLYEEFVVNGVRYACTDTGMAKLSYPASKIGYCYPAREGDMVNLDSTDYVCRDFVWRYATVADYHGECKESKFGMVVTVDSNRYICSSRGSWRLTTDTEDELGPCTEKLQGSILKNKSGSYYLCDSWDWYRASKNQVLGTCSEANEGDTITYESYLYECSEKTWKMHSLISKEFGFCTSKNKGAKGVYRDTVYYCYSDRGKDWAKASELELLLGFCRKDTTYIVEKEGIFYKCYSGSWKEAAQSDVLKSCYSTSGERKVYDGKEYVCDTTASKNWFTLTSLDSALGGYCKTSLLNTGVIYDKTVYMCRKNSSNEKSWQVGNMLDYMGTCDKYVTYKRAFNGVDSSWCMCASADNCYWDAILLDSLIDERVNDYYSRYAIVTLGNQKWLNRELHYASEQAVNCNGFRIKSYSGGAQNTEFYYNWNEVFENLTTICPAGSHVATKAEWQALFDFAENLTPGYGVRALLERSNDPPHSGYNLYGVRLNRSGYVDVDTLTDISYGHGTHRLLQNSYFWLPESTSDSTASYVLIDSLFKVQYKTDGLKKDAYQVRCVVD